MANTIVKTPIVYYGGKTSIVNYLLEMVPLHEVYTETFFGGGTLFWAKDPVKNETINDRLDIVINFYKTVKLHYVPLKKLIDATLIARSVHGEALNYIRGFNKSGIPSQNLTRAARVKLAWAFWVCTNFAYSNKIGGGYKYSNHMSVAVPDTLAKRKTEFTEKLVERIQGAYIENDDALKILASRNVENAFHYIDPPYPNADQGHYPGYKWDRYEKLLQWCATDCKGKFLLSSYNSVMLDGYTKIYEWHKKEINHKLSGSKAMNARSGRESKGKIQKTEVLISNYATPCGTLSLFD